MGERQIILWRHGRTSWNAERRFQGQSDIDLDDEGRAQAERAAELLAYLKPDRIIASDLARAWATAQALSARTGVHVTADARLRETFAGEWEGLSRAELLERHGDEVARWASDSAARPGGGETRIEVADRVVAAITDGLDEVAESGTLVVATHGGAARAGIGALLELPPEQWACLGVLSNCAWSILSENTTGFGPAWRLQEYNAGSLSTPALADDR